MLSSANIDSNLRLNGAMLTDVGLVRPHNEDCCEFSIPSGNGTDSQDSLLLVADGMGGHATGEVASRLAVDVIRRAYFRASGPVPDILAMAFSLANKAIIEHTISHPECAGMGTTCTALAMRVGRAFLAHVGDSRAYLLRGATLTQLSQDQTLVAKLVRDGVLTPDQARHSDHSNVIMQALGTSPQVQPEIWNEGLPLAEEDIVIMSTDGLHGLVSNAQIAEVAARLPPDDACRALIKCAHAAGGNDNISVGVFRAEKRSAATARSDQRATRPIVIPAELRAKDVAEPSVSTRKIAVPTRRP
jgi:serine/threonine protein phosphatase PrpC